MEVSKRSVKVDLSLQGLKLFECIEGKKYSIKSGRDYINIEVL
jgi:hypothetical protein